MQGTPQDLDDLLALLPDHNHCAWPHAGVVSAFVRICDALQPNMVWAAGDSTRANWLCNLDESRFWVARTAQGNNHDTLKREILQVLAKIARKTWRGAAKSPFRQLNFVKDLALRAIAERDLASLAGARKSEETKVALVLAGGIIECLLTDALEHDVAATEAAARGHPAFSSWGKRFDPATPTDWTFIRKIDVCGPKGLVLLSDKTEAIAHQVRDWRNLVHPHLERIDVRTSPLRASDAAVAEALVQKIIDELAEWRIKNP